MRLLIPLLLLLASVSCFSQEVTDASTVSVINRAGISMGYYEQYELSKWSTYSLDSTTLKLPYVRAGSFFADKLVLTGTATNKDYEYSGYDRGHLSPARDFPLSTKETYSYANVAPMNPSFNRGMWSKLEDYVRTTAISKGSIKITTGPIVLNTDPKIGPNEVSIPSYFYKVVLYKDSVKVRGVGFIMPNRASSASVGTYAVSIDSVETLTKLNLFPELELEEAAEVERSIDRTFWGL